MQYTKVNSDQFEWIGGRLVHHQTGAWFEWRYPNSQSKEVTINWAAAGDLLPNGDDYERDEIALMALELLEAQRMQR